MNQVQQILEQQGVRLAGVASEVRQSLLKRRKPTVGSLRCDLTPISVQWTFSIAPDPLSATEFRLAFYLAIYALPADQFELTVWPWRIPTGIARKTLFSRHGSIADVSDAMQSLEEWANKRAGDIGHYLDSILSEVSPHHWRPHPKAGDR